MEIIIIVLLGLWLMAVFYIVYVKRSLKQVAKDMEEKKVEDTNTLLTTKSYTKEICEILQEFNAMMQHYREQAVQIERKNKQLQKTIVNISHDLRTPLTSALGYLEILQMYTLSTQKKEEYEQIVVKKLIELKKLIEDFFTFTRAIIMEEELVLEEVDSNRIFEESLIQYYEDFTLQKRKLHIQGSQKIKIISNERMLRRIFDNIIVNALKHSKSDVYIDITVTDTICYTFRNQVENTLEVERIFDEFYISDVSRTKQQTGLGLAIVKEFVEQLGGSVIARQKEGQLYIQVSWQR